MQETVLLTGISYIGVEFMAQINNYVPQKIMECDYLSIRQFI